MGTPTKKVLLISNPIAGRGRSERLIRRFVEVQKKQGCRTEIFFTKSRGDAGKRARSVGSDIETIVVGGGDGTLNEVLNGLPDPSRVPIAVLPMGTANILAHELALPYAPEAAAAAIQQKKLRWLDMGLVRSHRFLLVVSAGFDAMVSAEVKRRRNRRLGYGGYVLPMLRVLVSYRAPELSVTVDEGSVFRGALAVVSNTRNYGGIFTVADMASCDSGHLDVCLFKKGSIPALLRYGSAAFRGRISGRADVTYVTAKRVRIESKRPIPVQADGDPFGTTPVLVDLVPASVPIIVPEES